MFIGEKEVGKEIQCLAICEGTDGTSAGRVLLCYCDFDWSPLGLASHDSVADAQRRAERIYPGVSARWIEAHFTREQAGRYLDELWGDERCGMCGKRGDKVETFIPRGERWICEACFAEGPSSPGG
jgi:hypothetical protein